MNYDKQPLNLWSDLCAACRGYEDELECGDCWGCKALPLDIRDDWM